MSNEHDDAGVYFPLAKEPLDCNRVPLTQRLRALLVPRPDANCPKPTNSLVHLGPLFFGEAFYPCLLTWINQVDTSYYQLILLEAELLSITSLDNTRLALSQLHLCSDPSSPRTTLRDFNLTPWRHVVMRSQGIYHSSSNGKELCKPTRYRLAPQDWSDILVKTPGEKALIW